MTLTMFWATVQFITRLPVPSRWAEGADFQQYGRGVPAFPIVGLMVGVLAAGVSHNFQHPLALAGRENAITGIG